jgi:hypothetical protein
MDPGTLASLFIVAQQSGFNAGQNFGVQGDIHQWQVRALIDKHLLHALFKFIALN